MKRSQVLTVFALAMFPTFSFAETPPIHTLLTDLGDGLVSRDVELNEVDGSPVTVTQILRRLDGGSFEYNPAFQSGETLAFDARQCEPGTSATMSISVWGENTLHGSECLRTHESVEDMIEWNKAHGQFGQTQDADLRARTAGPGLTIVQSFAPGGYVVPEKVNSIHHGSSRYLLGVNSELNRELVIDGTCRKAARDYVAGGREGTLGLAVNCYIPTYGQKTKLMRTCANQTCHTARSDFTVF
jgi:hypothetical protein